MAIGIVLPQTRGREASVKDLVITILAKEWPLSTRKIYHRISKVYSVSCTYQAVHKSVKGLVREKVLVEKSREYCLNVDWLEQLKAFSEEVKQDYNSKTAGPAVSSTTLAFYSKYLDNYKTCLAELLKPRIQGLPVLYSSKSDLDSFGNRVIASKKETVLKSLSESTGNCLILGPSGSGKTTALMQAAYRYCKSEGRTPIIFNLSNFKGQSLLDIVHQKVFEVSGERMNEGFLAEALQKGSFVFFFDGLNEAYGNIMINGEKINRLDFILDQLNVFCFNENFKKNKFVISSRTSSDPKGKFSVSTYELNPFTEKQISNYLEKRNLTRLFQELESDKSLFDLCKNPLLLDMTAKVYTAEKVLPSNKTKLYNSYFNDLIYRWETKVLKKPELIAVDLENALASLAFETVSIGTIFPLELFLKSVKRFCKDQDLERKEEKQIISVAMKTNLILVNGSEARFGHHSFQEFFAAKELNLKFAEGKSIDKAFLKEQANKIPWVEPIIFLSGLLPDSTGLIKALKGQNLFLAGECAISANFVDEKLLDLTIIELLQLVNDSDNNIHWRSANILNRMGKRACDLAIKEVNSGKDEQLKRRLLWVLGNFDNQKVEQTLLENLDESNTHTLVHILLGLQDVKTKLDVARIDKFLKHDNPLVRAETIAIIQKRDSKKSGKTVSNEILSKRKAELLAPLVSMLKSEQQWVRMHAALALGKLNLVESVGPLIETLADENYSVRWHATLALGKIGTDKTVEELNNRIKIVAPKDREVMLKAVAAIKNKVKDRTDLAKTWGVVIN